MLLTYSVADIFSYIKRRKFYLERGDSTEEENKLLTIIKNIELKNLNLQGYEAKCKVLN